MLRFIRHEGPALLLAAMFGIVVTVLVAWLCQLRSSVSIVDVDSTGGRRAWPEQFPAGSSAPGYWHAAEGFGRSSEYFAAFGGSSRSMGNEMVRIQRAGFPARALEMVRWTEPVAGKEVSEFSVTLPISNSLPDWAAGEPVPVMPVWPGFAVDVVIFGAGVWFLVRGASHFRGVWRSRSGRCAACGYPVGASSICSECGKPTAQRPSGLPS